MLRDTCLTCKQPTMRLIGSNHQSKMETGVTITGKVDCLEIADVPYWFYPGPTEFTACPTNCKKCTSGNDCQLCGDSTNPNQWFFLDQSTTPDTCTPTNCLLSAYQYKVPGSHCLQCSSTTYYLEGSNPPACNQCLQTAKRFVEAGTNICKDCPAQCSECLSASECVGCHDGSKWLRADKISCEVDCGARAMKLTGSNPKKCQACPANCLTCDETNGCTQCDSGFYKISLTNECLQCFTGCASCNPGAICVTCLNANHFIKLDDKSCSQDCDLMSYKDLNTKKCVQCSPNCNSCDSTKYITCKQGYFVNNGVCQACPAGCKDCLNQSECLSCSNPSHYLQTDKVSCLSDCPAEQIKDQSTKMCLICSSDCLDCRSTGCLKCKPNLALINKKCQSADLVDYGLKQFYDPESEWTFNLNIILED